MTTRREPRPAGTTLTAMLDTSLRFALADGERWQACGSAAGELPGRRPADVLAPDLAAHLEAAAQRALDGEPSDFEWWAADGGVVFRCRPVPLGGEVAAVLVEGRSEADDAVVANYYRTLVESLPDAFVLVVDRDFRIVLAAGSGLEAGGFSREEFVGRTVDELVPEQVAELWKERYRRAFQGELLSFDHRGRRVDRDIWSQIVPVRGPDGEVEAAMVISQDISARKRTERELLRVTEELQRTVDDSPIGLALVSVGGSWIRVNPALCRLLGYSEEELRGLTFQHLTHPDDLDADIAEVRALVAGRVETYPSEKRYLHRDGHAVWALATRSLVRTHGEPQFFITQIQDLTAARTADAERRALDAKLLDAQRLESLGLLAGSVAHDFNNILVGVLGNASLIRERLPADDPLRANADGIALAAERAATLTQQLLAYAGKGQFVLEDVDLSAVVVEMDQLVGASLSRRATVEHDLVSDPPPVRADPGQIRQVVMNLLVNAIEALGDEDGTVTVRTAVVAPTRAELDAFDPVLPDGPYVLLEVADTGAGMDEATLAHVFDPFFTTKFTGRGLGLAATLGIVRGHGGGVGVETEPGRGTTFRILFPAGERTDPLRPAAAESRRAAGTVLVVDDDPMVRDVAADTLREAGYDVLVASDGAEAVEAYRRGPDRIGAIVLDIVMPGQDAGEVVRALRALGPTPIVLSSGYDEHVLSPELAADVAVFLQKPYRPGELRQAVVEAILGPASR